MPFEFEITPVARLRRMFPVSPMASTILNAVPDKDGYKAPTYPRITGNPAANPAPSRINPSNAFIGKFVNNTRIPKVASATENSST